MPEETPNHPFDRALEEALREAFEAGYNAGWVDRIMDEKRPVRRKWESVAVSVMQDARRHFRETDPRNELPAMCGRYTLTTPPDDLLAALGVSEVRFDFQPRYNIAPGQGAPVVARNAEGVLGALEMRWGLVPYWSDGPRMGYRMINARSETVHQKPAYRAAFKRRRCLVLADGFYEWQEQNGGPKQSYWIHRPDESPFTFAGLWESWKEEEDAVPLLTFTILTTDASEPLRPIHDRMPVILDDQAREMWMDPDAGSDGVRDLLAPAPDDVLETRAVSTYVNRPGNDGRECIEAVEAE